METVRADKDYVTLAALRAVYASSYCLSRSTKYKPHLFSDFSFFLVIAMVTNTNICELIAICILLDNDGRLCFLELTGRIARH
jgi:hypothetical protein